MQKNWTFYVQLLHSCFNLFIFYPESHSGYSNSTPSVFSTRNSHILRHHHFHRRCVIAFQDIGSNSFTVNRYFVPNGQVSSNFSFSQYKPFAKRTLLTALQRQWWQRVGLFPSNNNHALTLIIINCQIRWQINEGDNLAFRRFVEPKAGIFL